MVFARSAGRKRVNKIQVLRWSGFGAVDGRAEDLFAWGGGFGLWDEAGDAGVYYGIQALAGLDATDFVEGVLGEARDVEIFFGASGGFWSREEGGAALDGPGEEDLSGGFFDAGGDGGDDGIFDEAGSHAVAERGEGEKNDAVVFAILQEFSFGEIGVRFDLNDGGPDAGGLVERLEFVERDVGEADGAAFAVVDESFEGTPSVEESGFGIVDDVAVFVARVLVVAGLEGEGRVDEVEVEVGELKAGEAGFEGGFDAVGTVIGVPEFCGDEDVLAGDGPRAAARPSWRAMPTSRSLP